MGLDPNIVLQIVMSEMQNRRREERGRSEQERSLAQNLILSGAEQGMDIEKLVGLLGPNVLPPGFIAGAGELSKLAKKRRKEAETQAAAGGAPVTPFSSLEAVVESLRFGEREQINQQAERRRTIADQTREELLTNAAGLIALNPEDPALQQAAFDLVQQQFPEAPEEITRALHTRAAFQAQTGVGTTQSERLISLLPIGRRSAAREAILRQRGFPTQTVVQRRQLSVKDSLDLAERDDRAVAGIDLGRRMLDVIRSDPASVGVGAVIRGAIQAAGSIAGGVDSVLGTGTYDRFQQFAMDRMLSLDPDQQRSEAAAEVIGILNNPDAAQVDFGQLMLAFLLESSITGARRFSINAVERIRDQLRGGVTRPPAVTAKILEEAVRKLERDTKATRKKLRRLDPELESMLEPLPERQPAAEPDFTFDPARGLVPRGR